MRVLVIDDDVDVARLMVKILAGRGHVVQITHDGAAGLVRVRAEPPDVVVVHRDLPKLDGLEVCRRIKADDANREVVVILLVPAYIDIDDVGMPYGPDAFVTRPFSREVLANAVERTQR